MVKDRLVIDFHGKEDENIGKIINLLYAGGYRCSVGSMQKIGSATRCEFEKDEYRKPIVVTCSDCGGVLHLGDDNIWLCSDCDVGWDMILKKRGA